MATMPDSGPDAASKIEDDFEAAKRFAESKHKHFSDEEKLALYGLYKQAKEGANSGKAPSIFKLKEHAKHKAWMSRADMTKEDAMKEYSRICRELEARLRAQG